MSKSESESLRTEIARLAAEDVDPTTTLYVADRDLNVVFTNDQWESFAADNKGQKLLQAGWNHHLLENMSGREKARWASIYRLLLDGRLPHHEESFICSSPVERRIYRLRITPKTGGDGEVAWLIHHTIRIDDRPDAGLLAAQVRQIEQDPAVARREYRDRVLARRIRIPRYQVVQHFQPLEEMGGDILWDCRHPGGITDVVHADVSGHGDKAGAQAARLALLLDSFARIDMAPPAIIGQVNRVMCRDNEACSFATGLFFRFNRDRPRLTCTNFGHHGPIFSRTGQIHLETGFPLGLVEDADLCPETPIDLDEHGHRFLVFSDGITEQFDPEGEMFGPDRLWRSFCDRIESPLDVMLPGIVDDLTAFRGSALVKDDQTLVALEFVGG